MYFQFGCRKSQDPHPKKQNKQAKVLKARWTSALTEKPKRTERQWVTSHSQERSDPRPPSFPAELGSGDTAMVGPSGCQLWMLKAAGDSGDPLWGSPRLHWTWGDSSQHTGSRVGPGKPGECRRVLIMFADPPSSVSSQPWSSSDKICISGQVSGKYPNWNTKGREELPTAARGRVRPGGHYQGRLTVTGFTSDTSSTKSEGFFHISSQLSNAPENHWASFNSVQFWH